ncbi:MAG: DUF1330 domain-containing protein [Nocardioides sp.]|uniref:DUF1330 domain-containing protein n=1 Tax=Nocardioides sp. TaxID=35761 RepID=UPI0039E26D96
MPAYVISEVRITNRDAVERYKPLAAQAAAAYGGRYLARDAVPEALEGAFEPDERLVILQFDTIGQAHAWYASDAYRQALDAARDGLARRLFIVEGTPAVDPTSCPG